MAVDSLPASPSAGARTFVGVGPMRSLERMSVRGGAVALMLALTACTWTHLEEHLLKIDASAEVRSPSLQEDGLRVKLSVEPQTTLRRRTPQGRDYLLLTGPYFMYVEICDGDLRGQLTSIDVREAVLEVRHGDADVGRLQLSKAPGHWLRFGCFVLGLPNTPRLDLDFRRLKEVRFFLEFTGVYANGDRREYSVEQHLKPKVVHREENILFTQ